MRTTVCLSVLNRAFYPNVFSCGQIHLPCRFDARADIVNVFVRFQIDICRRQSPAVQITDTACIHFQHFVCRQRTAIVQTFRNRQINFLCRYQ